MLSISNIGAKQAGNYYQKDDYYTRNADGGDQWQGRLREELGLSEITKEDFDRLLDGKRRAGFDLCFSAPKSVSIAALCLEQATRADILETHNAAVTATLELIEQREIGTRVRDGNGGRDHVKTGNMIAGKFLHNVSRNQDPQLHTHAVIVNVTQYNGKMYSVDNPDLYNNKIIYGQIYRNTLADELLKRGYAVTVTDREKGFFELAGISSEALEQFSSRRQEIVQKLREWGTNAPEAAEQAALLTRQAKEDKSLDILREAWRQTLADMGGVSPERRDVPIISTVEQQRKEFEQAVSALAGKNFAFTERDLKRAVLAAGVGSGMSEREYETLLTSAIEQQSIKQLRTVQGETYYSTPSNIETERSIFQEISRTRNSMLGVDQAAAEQTLQRALSVDQAKLFSQQRQAVMHIATSRDQYLAVQGLAGTGKTHMLNYAREVLQGEGYTVRGACFTGKAAQGLEADAKIPSTTIHAFLNRLEKEAGNAPGPDVDRMHKTEWDFTGLQPGRSREVWVLDEASMVDNNIMRHVTEAARIKGAKVILVGDKQQLLPVGVGNAFAALTESGKVSTVTLDEIRRQEDPELLRAVREAVIGNAEKSMAILADNTQVIEKRGARLKNIVGDYTALSPEEQQKTVILTAANRDRKDINKVVRAQLVKDGQLAAGQQFTVTDPGTGAESMRQFAPGDKIIFLQNDYKLGVMNGQAGTVSGIAANSPTTLIVETVGKQIAVDTRMYNTIDHGYAMTSHKAQGITVDRVFVHLDSSQRHLNSRNAYYVDISRARHQVQIYTDNAGRIEKQVTQFAQKLTTENFISDMTEKRNLLQKSSELFQNIKNVKLPELKQALGKSLNFGR